MAGRDQQPDGGHPHAGGPGPVAFDQLFDREGLQAVRVAAAAHAARLGAHPDLIPHLMIIVSELASNAVRHGGGRGRLRLWTTDGVLRCEVSDEGAGIADPDGAGRANPSPLAPGGRGLWVVRQLCDTVTIDSDARGTTVTACVPLHA